MSHKDCLEVRGFFRVSHRNRRYAFDLAVGRNVKGGDVGHFRGKATAVVVVALAITILAEMNKELLDRSGGHFLHKTSEKAVCFVHQQWTVPGTAEGNVRIGIVCDGLLPVASSMSVTKYSTIKLIVGTDSFQTRPTTGASLAVVCQPEGTTHTVVVCGLACVDILWGQIELVEGTIGDLSIYDFGKNVCLTRNDSVQLHRERERPTLKRDSTDASVNVCIAGELATCFNGRTSREVGVPRFPNKQPEPWLALWAD